MNFKRKYSKAIYYFLPMLGHRPDWFPRLEDCLIEGTNANILLYTRTGGKNRNIGYGEQVMEMHPNFIRTYDDEDNEGYAYYEFETPKEWKDDLINIVFGRPFSRKYLKQLIKIFPEMEDEYQEMYIRLKNQ